VSPYLSRITLYPFKSLDGQEVEDAVVLRNAGLRHDREYCLVDENGLALNIKRLGAALIRIRSEVHFAFGEITLREGSCEQTFHLERESQRIAEWFSARLGQTVRLARDSEHGFPDDTEASGPTVVSTATLAEVGSWFDLDVEEVRRRFRANVEIDGVPAFWEDELYGPPGEVVRFHIGEVAIDGVNPCARCTVPSHDSRDGEILEPQFARIFAEKRRATLPSWADRSRFDHCYRLAVNTRVPDTEAGKELHVSDEIDL
jgi:MOSC domain-containing protein